MPDLAADNAARELAKLNQEEQAVRERIAADTARLTVISAQKSALEPLAAKAATPEAAPAQTKATK
jgi:hypothetical protein